MKVLFKKTVSVILALCLCSAFFVSVSAANGTAAITPSGSVGAGKNVTLTVSLRNATEVKGVAITPTFDKSKFRLVSGSWKVSGIMSDFSVSSGDGVIAFADPASLNGAVLTFTLKADDGLSAGKVNVGCSVTVDTLSGKYTTSASTSVKIDCNHNFTVKDTSAKYLKSAASCQSKALYYYSCSICKEKGTKTFESGEKTDHAYDQKKAAAKYAKSATSCTEKGIYYFSCKCGAKGTATFEVPAGHSFESKWSSDAASHWHQCSRCAEIKDKAEHKAGPAATAEKAQVCTVCNYVIAPPVGHTHLYEGEYVVDENGHHRSCQCGAEEPASSHNFDKGTLQGEGDGATVLYTCADCGFEKTEPASEELLGDGAPQGEGFSQGAVIALIILSAVLGLLAVSGWGLAGYLLISRKKNGI